MMDTYAIGDEIWIESNDKRVAGMFLKITKIGRLYITATSSWGKKYKIDRETFQCEEFYGEAFASPQAAKDYKLAQEMYRDLCNNTLRSLSLPQIREVYKILGLSDEKFN